MPLAPQIHRSKRPMSTPPANVPTAQLVMWASSRLERNSTARAPLTERRIRSPLDVLAIIHLEGALYARATAAMQALLNGA